MAEMGYKSTQSGSRVLAVAILRPCGRSDNGPGAGLGLESRFLASKGDWGSYAPTSTASSFCPGFLASAAEVLWQEVLWSWSPRRQAPPGWGPYASS